MRRVAISILVPLLAVLCLVLPAQAALKWCKGDPIVKLNGAQVQILVDIPEEYLTLVNGPIDFNISTPKSVARQLIFTDSGFNGYGEIVRFTDSSSFVQINSSFTAEIRVRVPVDESRLGVAEVVPVKVTIIPDNAQTVVVVGTSKDTTAKLLIKGR